MRRTELAFKPCERLDEFSCAFSLINSLQPNAIISFINDYSDNFSLHIYFPFHMLIIATRLSAVSSFRCDSWPVISCFFPSSKSSWATFVARGNDGYRNHQLIFNQQTFFDVSTLAKYTRLISVFSKINLNYCSDMRNISNSFAFYTKVCSSFFFLGFFMQRSRVGQKYAAS